MDINSIVADPSLEHLSKLGQMMDANQDVSLAISQYFKRLDFFSDQRYRKWVEFLRRPMDTKSATISSLFLLMNYVVRHVLKQEHETMELETIHYMLDQHGQIPIIGYICSAFYCIFVDSNPPTTDMLQKFIEHHFAVDWTPKAYEMDQTHIQTMRRLLLSDLDPKHTPLSCLCRDVLFTDMCFNGTNIKQIDKIVFTGPCSTAFTQRAFSSVSDAETKFLLKVFIVRDSLLSQFWPESDRICLTQMILKKQLAVSVLDPIVELHAAWNQTGKSSHLEKLWIKLWTESPGPLAQSFEFVSDSTWAQLHALRDQENCLLSSMLKLVYSNLDVLGKTDQPWMGHIVKCLDPVFLSKLFVKTKSKMMLYAFSNYSRQIVFMDCFKQFVQLLRSGKHLDKDKRDKTYFMFLNMINKEKNHFLGMYLSTLEQKQADEDAEMGEIDDGEENVEMAAHYLYSAPLFDEDTGMIELEGLNPLDIKGIRQPLVELDQVPKYCQQWTILASQLPPSIFNASLLQLIELYPGPPMLLDHVLVQFCAQHKWSVQLVLSKLLSGKFKCDKSPFPLFVSSIGFLAEPVQAHLLMTTKLEIAILMDKEQPRERVEERLLFLVQLLNASNPKTMTEFVYEIIHGDEKDQKILEVLVQMETIQNMQTRDVLFSELIVHKNVVVNYFSKPALFKPFVKYLLQPETRFLVDLIFKCPGQSKDIALIEQLYQECFQRHSAFFVDNIFAPLVTECIQSLYYGTNSLAVKLVDHWFALPGHFFKIPLVSCNQMVQKFYQIVVGLNEQLEPFLNMWERHRTTPELCLRLFMHCTNDAVVFNRFLSNRLSKACHSDSFCREFTKNLTQISNFMLLDNVLKNAFSDLDKQKQTLLSRNIDLAVMDLYIQLVDPQPTLVDTNAQVLLVCLLQTRLLEWAPSLGQWMLSVPMHVHNNINLCLVTGQSQLKYTIQMLEKQAQFLEGKDSNVFQNALQGKLSLILKRAMALGCQEEILAMSESIIKSFIKQPIVQELLDCVLSLLYSMVIPPCFMHGTEHSDTCSDTKSMDTLMEITAKIVTVDPRTNLIPCYRWLNLKPHRSKGYLLLVKVLVEKDPTYLKTFVIDDLFYELEDNLEITIEIFSLLDPLYFEDKIPQLQQLYLKTQSKALQEFISKFGHVASEQPKTLIERLHLQRLYTNHL